MKNNNYKRRPRLDTREQGTRDVPTKDFKTLFFENIRLIISGSVIILIVIITAIILCCSDSKEYTGTILDLYKNIMMIVIGFVCAKGVDK